MLKIGSHVSFSGKGLLNAATEAATYGATALMVYTGAPQNTRRKPIEKQFVTEGQTVMIENGLAELVVHAPYIINLATYKQDKFEFAVNFLQDEIRRTDYMGVKQIVLHPGSFTDRDAAYGIERIAEGLNAVLAGVKDTDVHIALETMAGKGSEVGKSFEEIAAIMDRVTDNNRITVCIDTCHLHEAGYDIIDDFDGVLTEFDRLIGLDRIAVVHLNDSKNPRGAGKDRHAPVGAGMIGFDAMHAIVHHEALSELPMILETPWMGKDKRTARPMYEAEIALLRGTVNERFGDRYLTDVEQLVQFFQEQSITPQAFVNETWTLLKTDKQAKKADPREPMERLYDLVTDAKVFPKLSEEQINHRLIGWFAQNQLLA